MVSKNPFIIVVAMNSQHGCTKCGRKFYVHESDYLFTSDVASLTQTLLKSFAKMSKAL